MTDCCTCANMQYAGRIYRNPHNGEVWINIGYHLKGCQRYLKYKNGIGITEIQFYGLMQEVSEVFGTGAGGHGECTGNLAGILCMVTAGVLSCPYCWYQRKYKAFTKEATERIARKANALGVHARLGLVDSLRTDKLAWLDSNNRPSLVPYGEDGALVNGPPYGYSIIITPQSHLTWPPHRSTDSATVGGAHNVVSCSHL